MNLSNSQELELWLTSLKEQGGELYVVNFYDYYKQYYCDKNSNIPEILLSNISILKKANYDELFLFENSSDTEFKELTSQKKFEDLEFAAHIFSILDEQFIKFLPIVIWSTKFNLFFIENGNSRMLNKFVNDKQLKCIYIRYPGHPVLDAEKTSILSVQELYNNIVYSGFENIERQISIVKQHNHAYDNSVLTHGILSYGDKDFHESCRANWKSNILTYKSHAITIDVSNLNLNDLQFNIWNTRSPNNKVEYSSKHGGILKLRNH